MKRNWSNILFGIFVVLLVIPQTGTPIKVAVNRLLAFSPSVEKPEDVKQLSNYEWQLMDLDGNSINLNAFKGKKILINFWATWCPPCIAEMPSMQALHDDYKDKAVFIFATNDNPAAIDKFLKKYGYKLPIYQITSTAPPELQTNSLPTTYFIDEKGNILIDKTGSANWNSDEVRSLLD